MQFVLCRIAFFSPTLFGAKNVNCIFPHFKSKIEFLLQLFHVYYFKVTVTSEPRTILNPEEESSMKEMVRTFNVQLNEQKKSVAKISKLCLGALNAIDQLETRVGNTKDETAKNQPMEKIKKLSEEHVRINALMNQMDHHIGKN